MRYRDAVSQGTVKLIKYKNGDMSMDYLSHNVSENLKRIRQSKGMSLDQVAEQTGVSKSMLAQIEKDRKSVV